MSHGASAKPWMEKLTLENYLNLEHMDTISLHILRKILLIHGFKSVNVPKEDLLDMVRSIKLMDAHHSTLQSDGVSSNAFLSLNNVTKDLSLLQWQECCITDIETINSVTDFGEEPSPKPLKTDFTNNTVVNTPVTLGLQTNGPVTSPITELQSVYARRDERDNFKHGFSSKKIKYEAARSCIELGLPTQTNKN